MGSVKIIGEGYYGIDSKGVRVDLETFKRIEDVFREVRAEKLAVHVIQPRPAKVVKSYPE